MSKRISRRKFLNNTGSIVVAGTVISKFGYNFASAANTDPISLLLGSHMDYLQALAPKYSDKFGVTPSIETVTTPDLSVIVSPITTNTSGALRDIIVMNEDSK